MESYNDKIETSEDFTRVFESYWEKVFAVCYNNLKYIELAKGFAQDIFLSRWERRAVLDLRVSMEHYLVKAAKNKVVEHFRNKAIRNRIYNDLMKNFSDQVNTTDESVEFTFLHEKVVILISKLLVQCKKVFKLSRELGMSNSAIADELSASERAVEYHISKALSFLRMDFPDRLIT